MTVTALDWFRHHVDNAQPVPSTPVGPDVAVGLSEDFGQDAFDALDWEVAFEVDVILTHGARGPLPPLAVVEMDGENAARADVAAWPNWSEFAG